MNTSRFAASSLVLVVALSLVACGGNAGSTSISHPGGDALVFRMETSGGFVAREAVFSAVPGFSLLGDGRVIEGGVMDMIYPGPAVLPLTVRTLSEAGIQAVLREVAATGLFTGDREFKGAEGTVMDAGTTIFTLNAGGQQARISVYALGMVNAAGNGVTAEEVAAHRALTALSGRLTDLDGWLNAPAWTDRAGRPYRADVLRLLVRNADADPPDPSGIANQRLPWPGATDPTTFGSAVAAPQGSRCGVVTGADAAIWLTALDRANALTRFVAAGHAYAVAVRPLLPDEPRNCPARSKAVDARPLPGPG
jgi:hypothetical protein